ncbi:jg17762 [Pararge aegeria aegeria]|uniref:Jg17762 protein n=1 Tax=Pararge aegeria aegeria TaxID=348720 RepID=A0A8S4RBI0_9NEOP|nr:jg17762 [Pararge aegeria aegeria]
MTSEEPIDVVAKKAEPKKPNANFPDDNPDTKTDKKQEHLMRTHQLMHLVYELPVEIERGPENNNMLKENPPITIVEITEQNGCETELGSARQCDSDYYQESSPDLGNKVVYDVLETNELLMQCADEFKEVIDRTSPDDTTDDDLIELKALLESKPKLLERYIRECASIDEVNRLHNITSCGSLSPRPHHEARSTSVTSDLFQLWLSSSPVKVSLCDNRFIMSRSKASVNA